MQKRQQALAVLFLIELISAQYFKLALDPGGVFVPSLHFNQQRLTFGETPFALDNIALNPPQLVHQRISVHRASTLLEPVSRVPLRVICVLQ
ncbi:hypothetical protein JQ633_21580 [Bradyrhizobium tropiciagri]|uniref:hypothetical protein n=1 Tax=Bradyrhizobium tropiciagri TaxID=312253 RepID=UPI001BAB5210|nr:hypothetical protein [Bradyrhizobium tropiciagri]MBR0872963.1 hypothetical protein [Bradyrhizobium tropiciagri]